MIRLDHTCNAYCRDSIHAHVFHGLPSEPNDARINKALVRAIQRLEEDYGIVILTHDRAETPDAGDMVVTYIEKALRA